MGNEATQRAANRRLASLHRYYAWSLTLRDRFQAPFAELAKSGRVEEGMLDWIGPIGMGEGTALMAYWYAALYVVIEGWRELKLTDTRINALIGSDHTERLRAHRNATCHYQQAIYVEKWNRFEKEPSAVEWVRALDAEFSRYFLDYSRKTAERILAGAAPPELKELSTQFLTILEHHRRGAKKEIHDH